MRTHKQGRSRATLTTLLLGACLLVSLGAARTAAADPVIEIEGHHAPTYVEAGKPASYVFSVQNIGDENLAGPVQLDVSLPPGAQTRIGAYEFSTVWFRLNYPGWDCGESIYGGGQPSVSCTASGLDIGQTLPLRVYVDLPAGATEPLSAEATVSAPGGVSVTAVETAQLGSEVPEFGLVPGTFEADAFDAEGQPERQAGAHPYRAFTAFDINMRAADPSEAVGQTGTVRPISTLRNADVKLPRGFVGNPRAVPYCSLADLNSPSGLSTEATRCPPETQIGTLDYGAGSWFNGLLDADLFLHAPIHNVAPPKGTLAAFGFSVIGRTVLVTARLDPRDHSVVAEAHNVNESEPLHFQKLELWGIPADPSHDPNRFNPATETWGIPSSEPRKPFISLSTQCGVAESTVLSGLTSWDGDVVDETFASEPVEGVGCNRLKFEPKIVARSTTNVADAPTGLEFEMQIPQSEDPDGLATAHLRDATVTLPAGMTVNPPSADGLQACSMEQAGVGADGLATGAPVSCPDPSKLGTVEAESPAVDHPLKGSVYLAEQNANPFGSLLAMYLVIDDPQTGVLVKLPGRVDPDPQTGQLTATFRNNPQLPVEELRLKLKEGPRAALKTPSTCGVHTTSSTLTPWSSPEGADATPSSSFELTQGPSGGACLAGGAAAPNAPAFNAGTQDPTAKAFSPFVLRLARTDGTQQIRSIDTVLPKGLTARLAGTTYCSDAALSAAAGKSGKAEQSVPSCPASSHVGLVNVGAGAGSTPLYVSGEAYLAGPYKGAPLSLAIVTPAVAGPFDLGVVVVRTALQVDPVTTQVRAVSDEIPQILQGIPLNVRSIAVKLDKPSFTLNPTSCDPMSIDGSALSVFNQAAALTNHFQVGECNRLAFKPKLQIKLSGKTKRSGHPALKATLTMPEGANIRRAQVTLPKTELLEQSHIRTICTRVQYAAKACPKAAVYGYAKAWSPLLDQPLEGPVYLRSSSNPLPDLVADLNGQIEVDLVGRIDSVNARIRNTFESVPDAPVSKFVLTMQGGKKSLLVNNTDLCKAKPKASMLFEAQNGKSYEASPAVKAECGKKSRKGGKGKGGTR